MSTTLPKTDEFRDFASTAISPPTLDDPGVQEREQPRERMLVTALTFVIAFSLLAVRLIELSVFRGDPGAVHRAGENGTTVSRAQILDRNGQILATNLDVASLYADPTEIWDVKETVTKLVALFPDLDRERVAERLTAKGRFVWIKRDLTPSQEEDAHRLGLPGLYFASEKRRVYLQGHTLAHVLGGVDTDNRGTAGIEKALDGRISAPQSEPLTLAIDLSVQHVLRDELQAAIARFSAKGAAGIVLDVNTGETLALASLPDFDPNFAGDPTADERRNRATLGVYEMGSTFKILTTAMALDSGKVSLSSGYDARQPIRIGGFTIRDYHPENRWLSIPDIFLHSSNIGSAKMAVAVGIDQHRAFLRKLGLMDRPAIEVAEVGRPLVPDRWHEINTMTIAFGHGMAVSPVQLVKAVSPIVNGGYLVEPTLLKHAPGAPIERTRVVSEKTSQTMRTLLRQVVLKGTGSKADVPGYEIGGKTGTAEKAVGRGYQKNALISSFLAIFPAQEPRYLVLVMVDEPKGTAQTFGFATAGWTAAPTAAAVIKRVAPILRVDPVWDAKKTVLALNASTGKIGGE